MVFKIFLLLVVVIALVFVVQCAPSEKQGLPDVLFIENPDTHPVILSPQEAMAGPGQNERACTSSACSFICAILGFKYGRCDSGGVCVCSNF